MLRSFSGSSCESGLVAQPSATARTGTVCFLDLLEPCRHAGLAEIFLRQDVGGDLRPEARHLDVVGVKHHRAVGIANLARGQPESDIRVGRLSCLGEAPLDPHRLPLDSLARPPGGRPRYIGCRRVTRDATLASGRARTGSLICFTPGPGTLGAPVVAARPVAHPRGSKTPLSGAVRRAERFTRTLSGERPAGLRTTRAEQSKARTAIKFRQELV